MRSSAPVRNGARVGKGIEMGQLALLVIALVIGITIANPELVDLEPLRDKFWLVALFPAVYMLGVGLLRD